MSSYGIGHGISAVDGHVAGTRPVQTARRAVARRTRSAAGRSARTEGRQAHGATRTSPGTAPPPAAGPPVTARAVAAPGTSGATPRSAELRATPSLMRGALGGAGTSRACGRSTSRWKPSARPHRARCGGPTDRRGQAGRGGRRDRMSKGAPPPTLVDHSANRTYSLRNDAHLAAFLGGSRLFRNDERLRCIFGGSCWRSTRGSIAHPLASACPQAWQLAFVALAHLTRHRPARRSSLGFKALEKQKSTSVRLRGFADRRLWHLILLYGVSPEKKTASCRLRGSAGRR